MCLVVIDTLKDLSVNRSQRLHKNLKGRATLFPREKCHYLVMQHQRKLG